MQQQQPQPFYLVDPPKPPAPKRSWAFPIFAGVITIGLSVIGFGFIAGSQNSAPQPTPSASAFPSPASNSQEVTPSSSPSPGVETQTTAAVPEPSKSQASLNIARVFCDDAEVINFRAAPDLNAQVLAVIENGELVEPGHPPNIVEGDGSRWIEVRYRNRTGWIVSKFIGE